MKIPVDGEITGLCKRGDQERGGKLADLKLLRLVSQECCERGKD